MQDMRRAGLSGGGGHGSFCTATALPRVRAKYLVGLGMTARCQ